MNAVKAIIRKELYSYFGSPMGVIFLVIFLLITGQLTFEVGRGSFFLLGQADLAPFLNYVYYPLLVLVPAVCMRLWSEERRSGTIELLFTMPITAKQAYLAKYIAAVIFVGIAILATFPMIITVLYLGNPDIPPIMVGYLGVFLMAAVFIATGSFFSVISKSQVVSFILSIVCCGLFLIAGSPPVLGLLSGIFPRYVVDLLESVSVLNHYEVMTRGVLRVSDLLFFAVVITGELIAGILLLDVKKAS
jgi:ABC-2 type transport system permease protein